MDRLNTLLLTARRLNAAFGFQAGLTISAVCALIAIIPEKQGIRIPVTCRNGSMGFIDASGRMVIAPHFESAGRFEQDNTSEVRRSKRRFRFEQLKGFPYIRLSRKEGIETLRIDRSGRVVARVDNPQGTFDNIKKHDPDEFGMTMVRDSNGVRWVKEDGSAAFPGNWELAGDFHGEDPAAVRRNGRWGFINRQGGMVTGYDWHHVYGFTGTGIAIVVNDSASGCIDREGRFLIPLGRIGLGQFDELGILCGGRGGMGVVDKHGKIKIPLRYQELSPFDRFGMAFAVIRTGFGNDDVRVGWIDRSGNTVIPFIYERYGIPFWESFQNHPLLPVRTVQGSGLIDRKGKFIVPPGKSLYDHVEDPLGSDRFWIVSVIPKYQSGNPFSPQCYDQYGTLIWQGSTFTRLEKSLGVSGLFALLSVLAYATARTDSARGASTTG